MYCICQSKSWLEVGEAAGMAAVGFGVVAIFARYKLTNNPISCGLAMLSCDCSLHEHRRSEVI